MIYERHNVTKAPLVAAMNTICAVVAMRYSSNIRGILIER